LRQRQVSEQADEKNDPQRGLDSEIAHPENEEPPDRPRASGFVNEKCSHGPAVGLCRSHKGPFAYNNAFRCGAPDIGIRAVAQWKSNRPSKQPRAAVTRLASSGRVTREQVGVTSGFSPARAKGSDLNRPLERPGRERASRDAIIAINLRIVRCAWAIISPCE